MEAMLLQTANGVSQRETWWSMDRELDAESNKKKKKESGEAGNTAIPSA